MLGEAAGIAAFTSEDAPRRRPHGPPAARSTGSQQHDTALHGIAMTQAPRLPRSTRPDPAPQGLRRRRNGSPPHPQRHLSGVVHHTLQADSS